MLWGPSFCYTAANSQNTDSVTRFGCIPLAGAIAGVRFMSPVLSRWRAQQAGADTGVIFVSDEDEDVICVRERGSGSTY